MKVKYCFVWIAGLLLLIATSRTAEAQAVLEFNGRPRIRLGPLGVTPTVTIEGLGIDNNVFNEADDPKQDLTGGFSPAAEVWLRAGRFGARIRNSVSLIYFREFT